GRRRHYRRGHCPRRPEPGPARGAGGNAGLCRRHVQPFH
ncbi:MAG: Aerobic glycerol-3-phosphate dehydrogenase, partial [uncultured Cytophagales bacterium]